MGNLDIYDRVRSVPPEAQKTIRGGRLKGMTDINPMWRIKTLTEQFGVCGVGWKYEIVEKWIETSMAKDEITANVIINLYIAHGEDGKKKWSDPIPGIGGSMLVASESKGLYVDDECYKKALTDAISVACKALGMGADIYWGNDRTKYSKKNEADRPKNEAAEGVTDGGIDYLRNLCIEMNVEPIYKGKPIETLSKSEYMEAVENIEKLSKARKNDEV